MATLAELKSGDTIETKSGQVGRVFDCFGSVVAVMDDRNVSFGVNKLEIAFINDEEVENE